MAHADVLSPAFSALCRTINQIKDLGCKAGVVLNPGTPLTAIEYVLDQVDLVLIMSVNPGENASSIIKAVGGCKCSVSSGHNWSGMGLQVEWSGVGLEGHQRAGIHGHAHQACMAGPVCKGGC